MQEEKEIVNVIIDKINIYIQDIDEDFVIENEEELNKKNSILTGEFSTKDVLLDHNDIENAILSIKINVKVGDSKFFEEKGNPYFEKFSSFNENWQEKEDIRLKFILWYTKDFLPLLYSNNKEDNLLFLPVEDFTIKPMIVALKNNFYNKDGVNIEYLPQFFNDKTKTYFYVKTNNNEDKLIWQEITNFSLADNDINIIFNFDRDIRNNYFFEKGDGVLRNLVLDLNTNLDIKMLKEKFVEITLHKENIKNVEKWYSRKDNEILISMKIIWMMGNKYTSALYMLSRQSYNYSFKLTNLLPELDKKKLAQKIFEFWPEEMINTKASDIKFWYYF